MIKNFEETKKQLAELAEVINAYKSEAVQLRIVELVFQGSGPVDTRQPAAAEAARDQGGAKRPAKRVKSTDGAPARGRGSARRAGPGAAVGDLIDEGYFKERRQIGAITQHLRDDKATPFKMAGIAVALNRAIKDRKLKREKNGDGQYEYFVS